jgi:hypothetical protein
MKRSHEGKTSYQLVDTVVSCKTNEGTSSNMGCIGIWLNRSAGSGRSLAARAHGALLCSDDVSPDDGLERATIRREHRQNAEA